MWLVLFDHVAVASELFDDVLELGLISTQTAVASDEESTHRCLSASSAGHEGEGTLVGPIVTPLIEATR